MSTGNGKPRSRRRLQETTEVPLLPEEVAAALSPEVAAALSPEEVAMLQRNLEESNRITDRVTEVLNEELAKGAGKATAMFALLNILVGNSLADGMPRDLLVNAVIATCNRYERGALR